MIETGGRMTRWQSQHVQTNAVGRVKAKPNLRLCGDPSEGDVLRQVIQTLAALPSVALVMRLNSGGFTREDAKGTKHYYSFGAIYSALAVVFLKRHIDDYSTLASAKLEMPDVIGMLHGGRLFAFEVKKRGKKATHCQAAFIDLVAASGGIGRVIYSSKEAADALIA